MDTVGALQLVSKSLQVGEAYAELQRKHVRQIVLNCALKRIAKRRLVKLRVAHLLEDSLMDAWQQEHRKVVQMRNAALSVLRSSKRTPSSP